MHHRVLQRQLRKLGLDPETVPAGTAAWQHFLERIAGTYADADQDRYLLERSLAISSLVLVVDDEHAFREITRHFLAEHGYRVLTARDGVEALDLFQQFHSQICVVLTDLMMPAMDGRALIRALHGIDPGVKVIAASGLTTLENLDESIGGAVQAFLPKPYEPVHLLATLSRLLHETDPVGVSSSC